MFPFVKISAGLDFQTLVEHRFRPPIAFRTIDHLRNWMAEHDLRETSIRYKKRREIEAELCFVVEGKVTTPLGALHYSQVWAHVNFGSYRAACERYVEMRYGSGVDLTEHDVDHAVSSKHLRQHWPGAWINIFYAENGINRSVGAMLEKTLLPPVENKILFNLESLLKLFYEKRGQKLAAKHVRGYFISACNEAFIVSHDNPDLPTAINIISARSVFNGIAGEYDPELVAF
ncbi:hypothetical protein ASF91_19765 [Rhizobium sp. Leaf155]|nr:hypothetical protein ASF91_19765 [Rhizobium sp. Leaf155]